MTAFRFLTPLLLATAACVPMVQNGGGGYASQGGGSWYGGQVRIISFQATIAPTKMDGKDWDAFGGKPDPNIRLLIDGNLIATCQEQDLTAPTCEGAFVGKMLNLKLTSRIEIQVMDSDAMNNDFVGNGSGQASNGTITMQTNGQLTSASLVVQAL